MHYNTFKSVWLQSQAYSRRFTKGTYGTLAVESSKTVGTNNGHITLNSMGITESKSASLVIIKELMLVIPTRH